RKLHQRRSRQQRRRVVLPTTGRVAPERRVEHLLCDAEQQPRQQWHVEPQDLPHPWMPQIQHRTPPNTDAPQPRNQNQKLAGSAEVEAKSPSPKSEMPMIRTSDTISCVSVAPPASVFDTSSGTKKGAPTQMPASATTITISTRLTTVL